MIGKTKKNQGVESNPSHGTDMASLSLLIPTPKSKDNQVDSKGNNG